MNNYQHRSVKHKVRIYFARHLQAALNSLGQLSRAPMNSLATCLIIGIALALPTALFGLLKNAELLSHNFQQSAQVVLYLKKDVSEERVNSMLKELRKNCSFSDIRAISPEQGLKELQQQAGFQSMLQELQDNPLPWTLIISPTTALTADAETLSDNLKSLPEVDNVQLDIKWIKRLQALILIGHSAVQVLAFFLGLAVLLIVNNSIRSATQNNHKEIAVIKLLGGTNRFIRRPFLYVGMIYGLLGSIIAWYVVDILFTCVRGPIHRAALLYDSNFNLLGLGLKHTVVLILISVILGFVGAWLAVVRHLK